MPTERLSLLLWVPITFYVPALVPCWLMCMARQLAEQRLHRGRAQDAKTNELNKFLQQDRIHAAQAQSDVRVENLRRTKSEAVMRQEILMEQRILKREQEKERKEQLGSLRERLADALAQKRLQEQREELHRQRVCDESEELGELRSRLHTATMNKIRAKQLLEQKTDQDKENLQEQKMLEHLENERLEGEEMEHRLNIERRNQRENVKCFQQHQMCEQEASREEEARLEYEKDREVVGEIARMMEHEHAEESLLRRQTAEKARRAMMDAALEQQARQQEIERRDREDDARIERHAKAKADREEVTSHKKKDEFHKRQRIVADQFDQLEAKYRADAEMEQIRQFVYDEKIEAEHRRKEEHARRRKLESKEELASAYRSQMEMKAQKRAAGVEEEARMREELLDKFAKDDRLEQLSDARRRAKLRDHRREVERLIDLRHAQYQEARVAERVEQEAMRQQGLRRQAIIDSERQRMLEEQAPGLRDFLPKGTIESAVEYQRIFPERVRERCREAAPLSVMTPSTPWLPSSTASGLPATPSKAVKLDRATPPGPELAVPSGQSTPLAPVRAPWSSPSTPSSPFRGQTCSLASHTTGCSAGLLPVFTTTEPSFFHTPPGRSGDDASSPLDRTLLTPSSTPVLCRPSVERSFSSSGGVAAGRSSSVTQQGGGRGRSWWPSN
eukprot:TRINITY_DN63945_c0_g1_i1.p1 TRINITY_DN63945_c0_g1~~TRINITY_DN63945_c0_g1_i1.p1  ORF type:complete len:675 (+),score=143.84 TRINITY_DN63945_c0_g1_i1:44-2068(+)